MFIDVDGYGNVFCIYMVFLLLFFFCLFKMIIWVDDIEEVVWVRLCVYYEEVIMLFNILFCVYFVLLCNYVLVDFK